MKLRSLDTDSEVMPLGQTFFLMNALIEKQRSSTRHRLDFYDKKNQRFFSVEGNAREIEVLDTLHKLIGPCIPLELLREIPETFPELRNRRSNPMAYREGIVHLLQNIYHISIPDFWESDVRAFNKWLKTFELSK
jgi:hypothetical protein